MSTIKGLQTVTGNAVRNVGGTPWGGLGRDLPAGCTIERAAALAGMDWEAKAAPAVFVRDDGTSGDTDQKVIYRGDTGRALSVMGSGYQVVQPRAVLEFFRSATENGGWHLRTAGTINGGRKLWALAEQDGAPTGVVKKGDEIASLLLLSTSLDGTSPTRAQSFALRLVCDNGMARAVNGAAVKVSHRSQFDPAVILSAMQAAGDDFAGFLSASQRLAETGMSDSRALELLRELFPSNSGKAREGSHHRTDAGEVLASAAATKRAAAAAASVQASALLARLGASAAATAPAPKDHRNVARIMELFKGAARGADLPSARGTAWGLLNAVTEFVDHEAGRADDSRLDSAWFGRGQALKAQALELIGAEG